jgi:hypothetical protein
VIFLTPPTDFSKTLKRVFDGRLRIRWSAAKEEWHIEQQVGRAAIPPFRISEIDDRFIRARDGYHFVMAVKPANYTWCRQCHLKCSVPELRSGEIKCSYCENVKTRRGREFGGYWPLTDALLDHLRKIDPYRDGHLKALKDQDAALDQREVTQKRDIHNIVESAALDDKYQLFDTPFSGYTGKTFGTPDINGHQL